MAERKPIPLVPVQIGVRGPEFEEITSWAFADPFVARILRVDLPQRTQFGNCRLWIYKDPKNQIVGLGSIDVCQDYGEFTGGKPHPYIPLVAVNPSIKSQGYGTTILKHLIAEAALLASGPRPCHDILFLDVYVASKKAIDLYRSCGFSTISPKPIPDPREEGKPYIIMAKKVSILKEPLVATTPKNETASRETQKGG